MKEKPRPVYTGPKTVKELKRGTMPPGVYYRLGEEDNYKTYVNQVENKLKVIRKFFFKPYGISGITINMIFFPFEGL